MIYKEIYCSFGLYSSYPAPFHPTVTINTLWCCLCPLCWQPQPTFRDGKYHVLSLFFRTDSLIVTSLKYNIKNSSLNVKHWIIPFLIKFDCLINIDEWSCNWQIYLDSSITLPSATDVLISWIMAANCSRHKPVRIKNFVLSTTFACKKSVVAGSRYLIWHVAKRF